MMRREAGRVFFDLTEDEYDTLLLALGYAIGASESQQILASSAWAREYGKPLAWLRLANAINEGNPNWVPYTVPDA